MAEEELVKPAKDVDDVELVERDLSKVTKVGEELDPSMKEAMAEFLKKSLDIFAWTYDDMLGIDDKVIEHCLNVDPTNCLNVDPTKKLVQQKRQVFAPERNKAVIEEVEKLLIAGFIQEVFYPEWLANIVMVKKPNGKLQMCVDFTDFNNAYPKDSFPLPKIDQLEDSTAGHGLLTFMDAFSGYNQIRMNKEDQEKTTFVTSQRLYCYMVMPFGLKMQGLLTKGW